MVFSRAFCSIHTSISQQSITSGKWAWYGLALVIENERAHGRDVTGGEVDVWKCFDPVIRQLLYCLAKKAGMPERIWSAYARFVDNLEVRSQIGTTLGVTHKHVCSIPQGCPFSVTMLALILSPWAG